MKRNNETNSWNYGCTKENIEKMLSIYKSMVNEVNDLETMVPSRRFTLDGHFIGSIGESIAGAYYGIQLAPTSTKAIDGAFNNRPVQIKTVQQDNVMLSYDGRGIEPYYLLVLYLNKDGTFYEVYNGPWVKLWDNSTKKDSHGYQHVSISRMMELTHQIGDDERIPQLYPVPAMKREFKNLMRKNDLDKRAIAAFAKRNYDAFGGTDEEIYNYLSEEDFPEKCWELGFTMDTANMFVAMYGDAFSDVEALRNVIKSINDKLILGSGIFSKWRHITHWSYEESLTSAENREWFKIAFNRLYEISS